MEEMEKKLSALRKKALNGVNIELDIGSLYEEIKTLDRESLNKTNESTMRNLLVDALRLYAMYCDDMRQVEYLMNEAKRLANRYLNAPGAMRIGTHIVNNIMPRLQQKIDGD